MEFQFHKLYKESIILLQRLTTSKGILASTIASDNYKRVWARDSMICGIAGILADDKTVINGLKQSLLTLSKHQHDAGMIPSNVLENDNETDVSYGSLVGRVDTNTWFIIGACLHYLNTKEENTWQLLLPSILKSRTYLKTIELNGKGWIYTPLSGNWADEYPIHGYTLYDNMLRLWGESLYLKIQKKTDENFQYLKEKTHVNFWPQPNSKLDDVYQERPFLSVIKNPVQHFCSTILPGKYNTRFDAAGNALALLSYDVSQHQKEQLKSYVFSLKAKLSKKIIPAFWPPIQEKDNEWHDLKENYAFSFKNKPYHFHNGGIWPIWMGLFCLGLSKNNLLDEVNTIVSDFMSIIDTQHWNFQEYITSDSLKLEGKQQMGFSASGVVFMFHALHDTDFKQKLGL